jgi:hypothetical protein
MQTPVERGCGLDVHQATVVACSLMVRRDGKVQKQMRMFGTTTRELMGLREWLLYEGCTYVALESTGVYVQTAKWPNSWFGVRGEEAPQNIRRRDTRVRIEIAAADRCARACQRNRRL